MAMTTCLRIPTTNFTHCCWMATTSMPQVLKQPVDLLDAALRFDAGDGGVSLTDGMDRYDRRHQRADHAIGERGHAGRVHVLPEQRLKKRSPYAGHRAFAVAGLVHVRDEGLSLRIGGSSCAPQPVGIGLNSHARDKPGDPSGLSGCSVV